ncbi:MAG: hypothetical protein ICV83_12275 [Cytophagales bacterium]|nr:hypothetical protein [Cytophagales bacterium]
MSIQARGMEVILEEVEHLPEDGFYKGTGRVSINYLGGAAFAVKFDRIYIDEDRNVVSGRIDVLSQGVEAMSQQQLASQQQRQKERQQQANRDKYQDLSFAEGVTKYDELIIANVQVDPASGQVILTDEKGRPYQDAKLSALVVTTGTTQTLVIEDKNGDQWIIKPDRKAEKVPGGGLPPVNKALVTGPAVDLVKKALKELRKEYNDQKILQLDNERKRQDQFLTDYLTRVRQELGVPGTVVPTADAGANEVIILDASVATTVEADPVHVAKAQAHKTAERAYNLGVVVKLFAAETVSRKEYELIAGALQIEGQAVGAFITARQAQGDTEETLVAEVKKSILALIGQILDRN